MPGIGRGLVHQVPQRVVDQQEREDLLLDSRWVLGTQHHPRDALMVLDLVQGVLDLPPLGIEGGKLPGRCLPGVEEGGDQPVDGPVITGWAEGLLDHPHSLGVRAPVMIPRGNDFRQVGAVGEDFKHREYRG
ncbi:hypothetical protein [Streptomyces sp. NPDC018347]|uniref:hypothetical protein n=1 Tax=Streptomyces sp. NPDC018347 TaxID=3157193 RepID=UPI0033FEEFE6